MYSLVLCSSGSLARHCLGVKARAGMGSFLQMGSEQKSRVERVVSQSSQLDDFQRESVMDLLQGKEAAQSSGEITGMLKAMLEEMEVRRHEPREAIGSDQICSD